METPASITFDVFTLRFRKDGILHIHISDSHEYTVEKIKNVMPIIGKMVDYKKVPLLITRDDAALPSLETRTYWALPDSCPYSLADGYIIKTLALKLIGNFYLKINKPSRPSRMFYTEEEALPWLRTFL